MDFHLISTYYKKLVSRAILTLFKEFSYFLLKFKNEIEIENILRALRSLENVIIPVKIKQSVGFGPRQNLQSFEQSAHSEVI